ncbi:endonuclease/exonuclease/phosphatase family protein [Nocardioides sp.]|uniref:endonuclease/exonuclease/phosphatase family protein n=1 Tax=Nocardioides sp. TaxID=35761 RepID=UPI001A19F132|nr:endonuclease/exonuclease/phosphatase family protein [Nocardioides sp.]MBJ7356878.1 endonuclease/exonuclease/phosphatase family protein [Nocardioides sp.]
MRAHSTFRALLIAVLGIALLAPAPAEAHGKPSRDLTFMSYNLYLGSSLDPALDVAELPPAQQPAAFVAAVAQIYGTAVFTDFPTRAEAIADIIAADEPDVIGLQEVTNWIARPTAPGSAANPRSYDFLEILMAELAARGLDYEVAGVSQNADIGPAPLVAPGSGCVAVVPAPDCVVTLQDRDVILVNDDTPGLHWRNARSGTYAAQQSFPLPGGAPVSFGRGWVTIDVKYRGRYVHVANTHLEVSGFAAIQEAQAREFLAGPAKGPGADIALGDFNSAADGSTTDSYELLTARFRDAWAVNGSDPGYTSGQNQTLTNPVSLLDQRIDYVLLRGPVRTVEAHVVGDQPFRPLTQAWPIWPSDHAGVVATLRFR